MPETVISDSSISFSKIKLLTRFGLPIFSSLIFRIFFEWLDISSSVSFLFQVLIFKTSPWKSVLSIENNWSVVLS